MKIKILSWYNKPKYISKINIDGYRYTVGKDDAVNIYIIRKYSDKVGYYRPKGTVIIEYNNTQQRIYYPHKNGEKIDYEI